MEPADKYIRYPGKTNDFKNPTYDEIYNRSINDKEGFWTDEAKHLTWTKFPTKIVDTSHQYLHRWYTDGEMNICYNALDRHVEAGRGDMKCLSYDSAYTGDKKTYTYAETRDQVGKLASILKTKFGVKVGDRVLIYMPMVP